jgi:hypothetical protein
MPHDDRFTLKHVACSSRIKSVVFKEQCVLVSQETALKQTELETNSKNMNIRELYRGINYFKKSYKPRTNIPKDEKCDLVADSQCFD